VDGKFERLNLKMFGGGRSLTLPAYASAQALDFLATTENLMIAIQCFRMTTI